MNRRDMLKATALTPIALLWTGCGQGAVTAQEVLAIIGSIDTTIGTIAAGLGPTVPYAPQIAQYAMLANQAVTAAMQAIGNGTDFSADVPIILALFQSIAPITLPSYVNGIAAAVQQLIMQIAALVKTLQTAQKQVSTMAASGKAQLLHPNADLLVTINEIKTKAQDNAQKLSSLKLQ